MTSPAATETVFPVHLLDGCSTALVVFAAAFGGVQDAAFIRDEALWARCIDSDRGALERMRDEYPSDWDFWCMDAFEFVEGDLKCSLKYDVVTLDPFTGELMDRTIDRLGDFCALARRLVIVGIDSREIRPPAGWRIVSKSWRSDLNGGVFWTSLVPA